MAKPTAAANPAPPAATPKAPPAAGVPKPPAKPEEPKARPVLPPMPSEETVAHSERAEVLG
jgi:hypothetical protein